VTAKDPKPLAARQHPEIMTFNVLPPVHARGSAAVEETTRAWFDGYTSDIGYEVRDLWVRATLGCLRVDGRWLIIHDHESVPFEPDGGGHRSAGTA
jgi:ketosteroid isomerase-like protein